jgi:type II secretory pathway component GspD/PulD (secretin)
VRAVETLSGVTLVAAPSVTTLSGRQAQISVSELPPVSLIDPATGVTNQISLGPVLDVIPMVVADDVSIQLTVVTALNRLLGYSSAVPPTPVISQAGLSTQAIVRDGQTLILTGEFADEPSNRTGTSPAGVPSSAVNSAATNPRRLLVFITATIIDPAGNRMHPAASPTPAPGSAPAKP